MLINEQILNQLIKETTNSNMHYKHAAALVYKNQILSMSSNLLINNTISLHAESNTIFKGIKLIGRNLKYLDMIVIRINKKQELVNSRPCNACIDKMNEYGIRKVYYSTDNGNIIHEYINIMPKNHFCAMHKMLLRKAI